MRAAALTSGGEPSSKLNQIGIFGTPWEFKGMWCGIAEKRLNFKFFSF